MIDPGLLVLVAGPSGAGKDTLIDAARDVLRHDPHFVFPTREITRPAESGGEAHLPVAKDIFHARAQSGAYALWWEAHGLGYGLPASMLEDLNFGRTVIVNVSRTVFSEALANFPRVRVIHVTASASVIAARLALRGRENAEEIEARLARADAYAVEAPAIVTIINDGDLGQAVRSFLAALR